MKLYYSPNACSLAPHIIAREGKVPLELSRVTFGPEGRKTAEGEDFFQVNPKGGYVPALRLDSGEVLTENVAVDQYLSDQSTEKLMPESGSIEYYRVLEWLTYISTELHKNFSPLYNPASPEEVKTQQIQKIQSRMKYVEQELTKGTYLMGTTFTIADAYLYTIMRWTKKFEISLEEYPHIQAFIKEMEGREAVQLALTEEEIEPYFANA